MPLFDSATNEELLQLLIAEKQTYKTLSSMQQLTINVAERRVSDLEAALTEAHATIESYKDGQYITYKKIKDLEENPNHNKDLQNQVYDLEVELQSANQSISNLETVVELYKRKEENYKTERNANLVTIDNLNRTLQDNTYLLQSKKKIDISYLNEENLALVNTISTLEDNVADYTKNYRPFPSELVKMSDDTDKPIAHFEKIESCEYDESRECYVITGKITYFI